MAIDPITTTTTTATDATNKAKADKNVLGKDDFLKLMVAQMKNQDPMNPAGRQGQHRPDGAVLVARADHEPGDAPRRSSPTSMQTDPDAGPPRPHGHLHEAADGTAAHGQVSAVDVAGRHAVAERRRPDGVDPTVVTSVR